LFDGTSLRVVAQMMEEIDDELADKALDLVQDQFHQNFQHPTGYYESQVIVKQQGHNTKLITDQGIVYGPWLEGTGSRNRTTAFKGYNDSRKAVQQLNAQATRITQAVVTRYLGKLQ
jgi:hypothetical protein